MATNELHIGSLIVPKTNLSWHGDSLGGLSLFIEENFGKSEILPATNAGPLSFDIEFGRTNEMMYHTAKYGGCFGLVPADEIDGFFFKFPKSGITLIELSKEEVFAQRGEAVAFRGPTLRRVRYEKDFSESQISFAASYCIERLSYLIDRPVIKPLVFRPKIPLASHTAAKLATLSHFLSQGDFGDLAIALHPRAVRISTLALDSVLSVWPHTYSEELQKKPSSIAPRHVKAAIEYIRSHPAETTSPEYLASLSGVSLRSLQYCFKDVTGQTISEYQRELRLSKAREDILNTSDTIKDIAQKWGFLSSGRFSAYFREAYGIFPAELRRGKPSEIGF